MDSVKFAVFTDLHYDHVPDGYRRLQEFINKVKKTDVDFIIGLGDICYPIVRNRPVRLDHYKIIISNLFDFKLLRSTFQTIRRLHKFSTKNLIHAIKISVLE